MPKIHTCTQGELEWVRLRLGKVTASELDQLVTPEFATRAGEMPKTYLARKVAEAWRGEALPGFSSWSTEMGQILEDEARNWYAFEFDREKIRNVGFVEADDARSGCSPDALIDEDSGLELKCCEAHTHVRYLLAGVLPKEYAAQVHMSMFVTGRPRWKFVSYRRGFPSLVLPVESNPEINAKIATALASFYQSYDAAMATMRKKESE